MNDRKGSGSSSPLAGRRVLLGVSGGIAAYKSCILVRLLTSAGATVRVIMTDAATRFVGPDTFAALTGEPVHATVWEEPGSVLHVRLAREADIAVVAPATANTLAKLALGLADDLLSSALLEAACPLVVAPAMHTGMYANPSTQTNLRLLGERGVTVIGPEVGSLAAGDEGMGRMSEPADILAAMEAVLARRGDLAGRRILVTAGPTWEPLDPVRFIGNRSTGKMGFALASEARRRGADVTLVLGPGTPAAPEGLSVVPVTTAEEMRDAVLAALSVSDAVIMAAAVADFRPDDVAAAKIKKDGGPPAVVLVPTPDILSELVQKKSGQVIVGFAAETDDVEAAARGKLSRKDLDVIVANEVGREGTGFGSDTNIAAILTRDGDDAPLRSWTKIDLANAVLDRVVKRLRD
jgi:phosphopantothenoylcysteine decarboxylase/phosphopantothenate--cysteine ligase